jgi:hypothetical protein
MFQVWGVTASHRILQAPEDGRWALGQMQDLYQGRFHTKKHIPEWKESEKVRAREKFHRLGYKDKHKPRPERKKEIMKAYWERYPEKRAAHSRSRGLKSDGMELHHWSYNEEHFKDVIPLTTIDHARIHRYMVYEKDLLIYTSCKVILLDTRTAHEQFISEILNDLSTL